MGKRLDLLLLFGCGSSEIDGFTFCGGVSNVMVDMKELSDEKYDKLDEFLDKSCGLYDTVLNDYNACSNILAYIYKNFDVFDEKKLHSIQSFIRMHKLCGIWISLIMREDYYASESQE